MLDRYYSETTKRPRQTIIGCLYIVRGDNRDTICIGQVHIRLSFDGAVQNLTFGGIIMVQDW